MVNDTPTSSVNQEEKENIKENIVASKADTTSTDTKISKPESSTTNGTKQIDYNPNVKHPLKHTWTLWYDSELTGRKPAQSGTWGDNIKQVYTFSSVEDFWRLYNNVAPPSQIQPGCTYSLFKQGIEPKWEDPANSKGGKWTVIIGKQKSTLDRLWMWLLLACIGQVLEQDSDFICGAVVNVRKAQDKLCLWTRDADDKEANLKIGEALRKVLELPDNFPLSYQAHYAKSTTTTGRAANLYEI